MRFHKVGIAAAVALMLSTAACGTVGGKTASGTAAKKDVKSLKIGFAQRVSDAPYYVAMQKEAERLAKEKGFKLLFQSGGGDPVQQLDQVQTMLSQGVDVLIVNAVSANTEKSQLTAAAKQKPLLFIDTPIPAVGFTAVQSDNASIGRESGRLMARRVGKGKTIKLAILNGGPTDVEVGPARRQGFLQGLKEGGVNYTVTAEAPANYTQDQAVARTEDMLAAHPDIDVLFGYNDAMSLGALTVLKNKKNTHVLVGGVDGQKEALAAIKGQGCGGQYVSTALNSPTVAARDAVQVAIEVGTGQKKTADYPKTKYTESSGVDCDNVAKYYDPNGTF
ncbi:MAG: sugar transporter substrate-binding protein [Streptosporangiaceae bacterium]|nr:sugar transporter substrate-binding protein [Streptosporangiaceae bacterium]